MNTEQPHEQSLYERTGDIKDANTLLVNRAELRRLHAENEQLRHQLTGRGKPVGECAVTAYGYFIDGDFDKLPGGNYKLYTAPPDTDALLDQALEVLQHSHANEPMWKTPHRDAIAAIRKFLGK